jgi:hypothetical protein
MKVLGCASTTSPHPSSSHWARVGRSRCFFGQLWSHCLWSFHLIDVPSCRLTWEGIGQETHKPSVHPILYFSLPIMLGLMGKWGLTWLLKSTRTAGIDVEEEALLSSEDLERTVASADATQTEFTSPSWTSILSLPSVKSHLMAIFLVFWVTLSVFPAMTASVQSSQGWPWLVPLHFLSSFSINNLNGTHLP